MSDNYNTSAERLRFQCKRFPSVALDHENDLASIWKSTDDDLYLIGEENPEDFNADFQRNR